MTDILTPTARRADLVERYRARTGRSAALFARATEVLPGGSTRTTVYSEPYPPYIVRGEGATLVDVDGNAYTDFLGNYTSLILGHAHPAVVAAVEAQVRLGSAFAAPTELEITLAEEIVRRVPSIERVRFTNSGTEATMFALRLARAFTGRPLVGLFEGWYHGTHDLVMAGTPGVPDEIGGLTVRLPFDDLRGVERALAGKERRVAAIIVEPIQGVAGMLPASREFLDGLRSYTLAHGILLVFDEVISFRVARGGAPHDRRVHARGGRARPRTRVRRGVPEGGAPRRGGGSDAASRRGRSPGRVRRTLSGRCR